MQKDKQIRCVKWVWKASGNRNRKESSHRERQIRNDGRQILEVQMARQEGNVTEMVSQGRVWRMLNQKQRMQRCLWSGCALVRRITPSVRILMFFFCIISSSDDRIESMAILRHWLLAHDYGFSVLNKYCSSAVCRTEKVTLYNRGTNHMCN